MFRGRSSLVAFSVLLGACGGKAFWDPKYHSNHHPTTSSTGGDTGSTAETGGTGGAGGALASSVASGAGGIAASGSGGESAGTGGTPVSTSLEEVVLGAKSAGEPIAFDVPEGTLGFTVVVKASTPYGRMGIKQIQSPSSENVVDGYTLKGTQWEYAWYGLTPAGVPQSDAASAMPRPTPGLWSVTIGDPYENTTTGDVRVWIRKSSDGEFHGGAVDVNVFRVPGVASDVYIDGLLKKAYDGWAGLTLGKIEHYPLDEKFATVDGANFLAVVEQSKAATNVPAINVYIIEKFANEMKDAIGVASGIPGVGIAPGSLSSGVVISPTSDPDTDTVVIKHESGHLSGLFHTTEIQGGTVDPLGDTVTCSSVEQLVFGCPDSGNIMFPYANPAATDFSPMQQRVIHGATLYRGAFDNLSAGGMKVSVAPGAGADASNDAAHVPVALAPSTVTRGAWRNHLSARAADLLAAHWCQHTKHVDHLGLLARMATTVELSAVGGDPSTPSWIRSRAKRAALVRH